MTPDVIIIGAGISGLACALAVRQNGLNPFVLDAGDAIGGRVRTDRHGGFLLDRGFQVLQTWYPEARRILDYEALDLRPFDPGALVRFDGRLHRVTDVWRRPSRMLEMVLSPVAATADKVRLLSLGRRALRIPTGIATAAARCFAMAACSRSVPRPTTTASGTLLKGRPSGRDFGSSTKRGSSRRTAA